MKTRGITMTGLKCPFCNETELEKGMELQGGGFMLGCPKCKKFAHDIFWQALIDTKKKLDMLQEFVTKLYLNGNITDEQLHWLKQINKRNNDEKN